MDSNTYLEFFSQPCCTSHSCCLHIYSDNGSNFVETNKLLNNCFSNIENRTINNYLQQNGIVWSFNLPQASYMSGVWEKMIRTVRKVLLAVMPRKTLTDDDLHTILPEVESIVNLRPLTDIPLKKGEETPLTPNHLLRLNSFVVPPSIVVKDREKAGLVRTVIV